MRVVQKPGLPCLASETTPLLCQAAIVFERGARSSPTRPRGLVAPGRSDGRAAPGSPGLPVEHRNQREKLNSCGTDANEVSKCHLKCNPPTLLFRDEMPSPYYARTVHAYGAKRWVCVRCSRRGDALASNVHRIGGYQGFGAAPGVVRARSRCIPSRAVAAGVARAREKALK